MSVRRFLSLKNNNVNKEFKLLQSDIRSIDQKESCIILSENRVLKSSLLFQAALTFASEGDQVIFICQNPFLEKPYHVAGLADPTSQTLDSIKMVYISEHTGLLQYLCEFHTKKCFPLAIIVDDIQHYVSNHSDDQLKESALIKLLAILEDTSEFIAQRKGEPCHRLVSLCTNVCPKQYLMRYFREFWHISNGENAGEYFVTDNSVPALRINVHVTREKEIITDKVYTLSAMREGDR